MTSAAVCVVVPVYNARATLARCVDSILSQRVEGGLCCVLAEDGSTDGKTPALCDGYAARDARVRVVHLPNGGPSRARNAGMALAEAPYLVFLDADDALLPGALQAALTAQAAAPDAFVLWRYTTDPAVPAAANGAAPDPAAARLPAAALARLHLDCLLAMPWNKLYRTALARTLAFDPRYTLGEDLEFVLDYRAVLDKESPAAPYALVEAPLTYYDCTREGGTLSTRYLPDAFSVWAAHFARLNAAADAAAVPEADRRALYRAELTVLAESLAALLRQDPAPLGIRHDKAAAALRDPRLRELLGAFRRMALYSPYYLPLLWRNQRLLYTVAELKRQGSPLFGKLDWLGFYLLLGRRRRT